MNAMLFSYSYLIKIYAYSYFIKNPQVFGTVKKGSKSINVYFQILPQVIALNFQG